ncbi:MAG: Sapep family Mn(2+)-dependent dipeptidase [Clostridia bacterium]|nr:Sapep family Mn(2+)-dependent dipeptidase [Clostridia bacterium]
MKSSLEAIARDISAIVKYDSSLSRTCSGIRAPFGLGVRNSLDFYLSKAKEFGFDTWDLDGFAGEISWGTGKDFAILVHMDEVPAGTGWTHDPFGGEIDEAAGRIWGRGTMDDKGPAVIVLHAMKALKDEGFVPGRRIKLIAGCNEETGWKCIEYYTEHAHMPDEGFSPDADFPVIYAEKGILQIEARFEVPGAKDRFQAFFGGTAANMVCARCEAYAPLDEEKLNELGLEYNTATGVVISSGKAAHGSTPENGVNAIPAMLKYLGLDDIYKALFEDYLGLRGLEDETGPLTFSPDLVRQEGDTICVTCDIRYPATMQDMDIHRKLSAYGVPYDGVHYQAPLYNDKNSTLISTLLSVYNEVTGSNAEPIAIGGGTYARALKNGAGFGPEGPGEKSTMHEPDEYITFDKIEQCFEIYKLAIKRLCG